MNLLHRAEAFIYQHVLEQRPESEEIWQHRYQDLEKELMYDSLSGRDLYNSAETQEQVWQHDIDALIDLRRNGLPKNDSIIWFPSAHRLFTRLFPHQ